MDLPVLCKQYLDGSAFAVHVCFFTYHNLKKKKKKQSYGTSGVLPWLYNYHPKLSWL